MGPYDFEGATAGLSSSAAPGCRSTLLDKPGTMVGGTRIAEVTRKIAAQF